MSSAIAATSELLHESSNDAAGQYLSFFLDGEEYGVEILRVQEIKGWGVVTPLPNSPKHVLGVLNLRGAIVPIVDLRCRFGLEPKLPGKKTVVIVVRMEHADQSRVVGLVVDAVADVYRLDAADIQPSAEIGTTINTRFVRGLSIVNESMLILLEIDELVSFDVQRSADAANDVAAVE